MSKDGKTVKTRKKDSDCAKDPSKLSMEQANRRVDVDEDPLSNWVVLTEIFRHLDNADIQTCCQVNKCWNSIADPLFAREYDVSLPRNFRHPGRELSDKVSISKRPTYNTTRIPERTYTSKDASNFLEKAVLSQKVALNFTLMAWDENEDSVANFLLKFGNLAPKLAVQGTVSTGSLCVTLARFFPNLKQLDLSLADLYEEDDLDFDENLIENGMKHLKRIDSFRSFETPKCQTWIYLFRMAPNLKDIYNFPILDVDALTETGRGFCVKSIRFPEIKADEGFRAAFEKLTNLDLKLKVFDFHYWYDDDDEHDSICYDEIDPFLRKLLQSSQGSLESLSLDKTEMFDFQAISPMNALKTVMFRPKRKENHSSFQSPRKLISRETILPTVFPNVSCVKIFGYLSKFNATCIARLFPRNQFAPWGVRKLELKDVEDASVSILQALGRSFPSVTHLQIHLGSRGDELQSLQRIIPAISVSWPEVEVLSFRAGSFWLDTAKEDDWTFDSVFTGIPERDVRQLVAADPATWNTLFTPEQMERWKKASKLRKLSKLKVLKFELFCAELWKTKFRQKLGNISLVSKEFGFLFLPGFQIVVRTLKDEPFKDWEKDVKPRLEPLVNVKVEDFLRWEAYE